MHTMNSIDYHFPSLEDAGWTDEKTFHGKFFSVSGLELQAFADALGDASKAVATLVGMWFRQGVEDGFFEWHWQLEAGRWIVNGDRVEIIAGWAM